MSGENGLPKGWTWSTMAQMCEKIQDGTHFSPSQECQLPAGPYPYVTAKNVRPAGIDFANLTYLNEEDHRDIYERCDPRPGDVLLVKDGVNTGDAAINTFEGEVSLLSSVCMLRPREKVLESRFLRYYILSPQGYRSLTGQMTGTAIKRIILRKIRDTPVPVAPLNEQRRIVAKIEQLFSDLDAGVTALTRARANLKRYRAAVLKFAVEGRLTAAWRAAHPDVEPASELLKRILADRRRKWEHDQQAKYQAAGKTLPKNWQEKYAEPVESDTNGLSQLPEGWCWASVAQVTECLDHLRVPINKEDREKRLGDVPYFGANGQVGWIDDFLFDEPLVLVVEDETFVGREKPFSYKITSKSWVNNHAHILRPTEAIDTDFLNYSLMKYPFIPLTTGTTARRKLTKEKLMRAPLPLPPMGEQLQIANAVGATISQADAAFSEIERGLSRSFNLRQGVLKLAFDGGLA